MAFRPRVHDLLLCGGGHALDKGIVEVVLVKYGLVPDAVDVRDALFLRVEHARPCELTLGVAVDKGVLRQGLALNGRLKSEFTCGEHIGDVGVGKGSTILMTRRRSERQV